MIAVGLTMPALGAMADARRNRLRCLLVYTVGCVAFTVAIGNVATLANPIYRKGVLALAAFALANYFYIGGQTFYNSLLRTAAPPGQTGRVSGLGTALGYVGAIAGLLLVWPFVKGCLTLSALPINIIKIPLLPWKHSKPVNLTSFLKVI